MLEEKAKGILLKREGPALATPSPETCPICLLDQTGASVCNLNQGGSAVNITALVTNGRVIRAAKVTALATPWCLLAPIVGATPTTVSNNYDAIIVSEVFQTAPLPDNPNISKYL